MATVDADIAYALADLYDTAGTVGRVLNYGRRANYGLLGASTPPPPVTNSYLLLETGDYLLLETGFKLILEI